MKMKYLKTIALMCCVASQALAQVKVESAIDVPGILIGEQTNVTLSVTLSEKESAALPSQ